jgi:hypothetical protein
MKKSPYVIALVVGLLAANIVLGCCILSRVETSSHCAVPATCSGGNVMQAVINHISGSISILRAVLVAFVGIFLLSLILILSFDPTRNPDSQTHKREVYTEEPYIPRYDFYQWLELLKKRDSQKLLLGV